MKKNSKKFYPKFSLLNRFFFHMFDIHLDHLPPLCPARAFKESQLVFIEYMNVIQGVLR